MVSARDIYEKALTTWGEHLQLDKAREELGELVEAIDQYQSAKKRLVIEAKLEFEEEDLKPLIDHIIEEGVDVEIMLRQLRSNFPSKEWGRWEVFKVERLGNRLKEVIQVGN